ncbi:restriction endonuclease subunit S [Flavobacteriaceae bacterium]|nr:restriction endonuclease subunit S [Flavobacteriaceae bacterium]
MSWEEKDLGELCKIGRGSSPRPISNSKYFDEGDIPWVKIADATDSSRVIYKTKQHVNSYGASFSRLLPSGSLILSASGTVGFPMILGVEGCIHDGWLYFDDFKNITKEFLYYKLIDLNKYYYSLSYGGANIQNINTEIARKTKIKLPPLQTQKRIADILSAYDDLIENNLKRIKLLEQAAQNIYTEWFVNLRFSGHKNTPINEDTGLPEGWEEKEISTIITFLGGYAFKSKTYITNGKYRVITIKNVGDKVFNASVGNSVDSIPEKMKEHCKIIEGDILLSLTGNVGRSVIAYGENNLLNQRVAKIEPINTRWLPYIYWMFNDNKMFSLMNSLATGAAQQNLSPVKLAKEKVVIPSESVIDLYCLKANSVFKQIILLNKQNQKLKAARDILLPRLMNRTIEV